MNIIRKGNAIIVILIVCLTFFPAISFAHAFIVESSPVENETLKHSPNDVTIQFDESIQPKFNSIKVTDSAGKLVDRQNGKIDPKNPSILEIGLKKNLPNGIYRVQWKVLSNDGHPVSGVIPFQIGTGVAGDSATLKSETESYTPKADLVLIRWLQYIGSACCVGLLFFYLIIAPKKYEKIIFRFIWAGFLLLAGSIIINLPLQATIVLGNKWSEALSFDSLEQILAYTAFGRVWLIQMGLLFTLALTTHFISMADTTKRIVSWVCLGLGLGILLAKAYTSHAAGQSSRSIMITVDFLHLSAASIWIGCLMGLIILLPLLKKEETKSIYIKMVQRFSKLGIILVLLLAATGIFGAFQYIPTIYSLFHTDYGQVLTAKVGLFAIMLIFAAINFMKGMRTKVKGLSTSIWSEVVTGIAVLFLTIFLTNLPTAVSSPGPYTETNSGDQGYSLTFEVTPNMIGENAYRIYLSDAKGIPINNIDQVTLTFVHTEMDMGEDTVTLSKTGDGKYEAKGLNLNMSGKWKVRVHALTKDLDSIDTDFTWIVGSQK